MNPQVIGYAAETTTTTIAQAAPGALSTAWDFVKSNPGKTSLMVAGATLVGMTIYSALTPSRFWKKFRKAEETQRKTA